MAIDPRAKSKGRLKPPAPLPYLSRRALQRVRNALPPPTSCPYCGGPALLVRNDVIYGKLYGTWPYAYHCAPCDALVGLHPDTDIPLGTMANQALRSARVTNKRHFHDFMEKMGLTRSSAYLWLARSMGIDREVCHFGWFDIEACKRAGDICRSHLK